MKTALRFVFFILSTGTAVKAQNYTLSSPNKELAVRISNDKNALSYTVTRNGQLVLAKSSLGIVREDGNFAQNLKMISASPNEVVKDVYTLYNGKRRNNQYLANKKTYHLQNPKGQNMDIIFQVSNDGVAFRYYFPDKAAAIKKITNELSSFHFLKDTKAWMQPMAIAKSGWERTNPSYEEYYKKEIAVGTPAPSEAGWVYPALFNYQDTWILISEAGLDDLYCATRLEQNAPDGNYKIGFPDSREAYTNKHVNPESTLPWYTPWRILAIGSLKTITESTLGTDLAYPALANIKHEQFKPGKASWTWIIYKDNSIKYELQKEYIDFASNMKWEYCLIDADWDRKIGYDKMEELSKYAKTKNVSLLLWYNSAGDWNTVKYTPKNKLNNQEDRLKEFALLQKMGIKGIKVDFFGGDGQSMIQYYHQLFVDAAKFGLSVNCHGATLPRGWQRTYPNLLTMESIKGEEFITFEQKNADEEAAHATTIPFTRNVFDPMDFTPMNLYKIPNIDRKTSSAFELALPIIFQSGVQHLAETPEGMHHVPDYVKQLLEKIPTTWDDTKFIDGYPGKYTVLARQTGKKWYIAGINGENQTKDFNLDLSTYKGKKITLIADGDEKLSFIKADLTAKNTTLQVKAYGGFVIEIE
ncbi:glycoside hydrolase family 97 catalytic domain-containing protein [Pedobacter sp. MW01-1-1]|uniref:glycoside hydrolase family 97 catalytic domain-containing protein n=1 Tax=Pedobacter sp. MW01-1-1 TaxID=3383027 RepID=UPI003FEEB5A4